MNNVVPPGSMSAPRSFEDFKEVSVSHARDNTGREKEGAEEERACVYAVLGNKGAASSIIVGNHGSSYHQLDQLDVDCVDLNRLN